MGLENVRLRLARAEVAQVAEVFGGSVVNVRQAGDAGVAEVAVVEKKPMHAASLINTGTSEGHAEVAEVSCSSTHAQAHARARARGERWGRDTLQPAQPLHVPSPAIILRHCRCTDCRNFSKVGEDYFCIEYIGGTKVTWATGKRECDPPPDAWHYCACYHGPQVSTDVWVWRHTSRHVGARATNAQEVEQADEHVPARQVVA